jgi:hypothetical protein
VVTCDPSIVEMIKMKTNLLIVSMLISYYIPTHHPLVVHIEQSRPIRPRIRNSVHIEIVNNCNGITLGSGTCTILEGHDKHEFNKVLPPYDRLSTVIKSKYPIGRTRCCIVYELLNSTSQTTPLWWGYRVFLAVQVFTKPFSDKSKAAAVLFKIKDRAFNGGREDIDNLHKDILQHSLRRPSRAAVWNLDGQALSLIPKFEFNVPASVKVVLEKVSLSIEHDPIFHRTRAFA